MDDTLKLLKECNSGCKNATNSMEHAQKYVKNEGLKSLIAEYDKRHISLGDECHKLLSELGVSEKDPDTMGKMMTKAGVEMRLMMNDTSEHIAGMLLDGCSMGIKSVGKYINQYPTASPESVNLARRIVSTEQEFMNKLIVYL